MNNLIENFVFSNSSMYFCFIFQMFNIYIQRAAEIYGVTHTRTIYEKAIDVLHEHQARFVQNVNYNFDE